MELRDWKSKFRRKRFVHFGNLLEKKRDCLLHGFYVQNDLTLIDCHPPPLLTEDT